MKVTIDGVDYVPARQVPLVRPIPIWQLLSRARKAHKMTLEQVGRAAGISAGSVCNAESAVPSLSTLVRLVRVYRLDGNEVFDSLMRMDK